MSVEHKKADLIGVRTALTDREGEQPAIVCIHGNSLSRKMFEPLLYAPSLDRYRLVSYDLPGHGESERVANPREVYTMKGYGAHLAALIGYLGAGRIVLVGLSLGGHIALQAADTPLPAEPAGLLLFGSPPIERVEDFSRAFLPQPDGLSLFRGDIDRAAAEKIARCLSGSPAVRSDCVESILATDPLARSTLVESFATETVHDESAFVTGTDIPLLLGFGEKERVVNLEYLGQKRLEERLGGCLRIFPGEDHLPDLKEPGTFVSALVSLVEADHG